MNTGVGEDVLLHMGNTKILEMDLQPVLTDQTLMDQVLFIRKLK